MSERRSYEVVVSFAGGGGCGVPRVYAESFDQAVVKTLSRINTQIAKTITITDLRYEDESETAS